MPQLHEKMQTALNEHINAEFSSAYIYLAMAAHLESIDMPGFASWMRVQAKEEDDHGHKLFDYVIERGGRVTLSAIDAPPVAWKSLLDTFEAALAHELKISGEIDALVNLAIELKDRATESLLRWFVDEQVEEEATMDRLVKQLRMGADSPTVLLMLDKELAGRTYQPPAMPAA